MSKENTFVIKTAYALSAIDHDGNRVYYYIDNYSGGYPYWSSYPENFKNWESLDEVPIIGHKDNMRQQVTKIEVIRVEVQAKVVSTTEIVSEAKAKAMAEIAKIQKDLEERIAKVENMQ